MISSRACGLGVMPGKLSELRQLQGTITEKAGRPSGQDKVLIGRQRRGLEWLRCRPLCGRRMNMSRPSAALMISSPRLMSREPEHQEATQHYHDEEQGEYDS